jgi:hypothetical protein
MKKNQLPIVSKRECGSCTKCCEGFLSGTARGKQFYKGRPCHFVSMGKGCTIYSTRPKEPCATFKCVWLTNEDFPEWLKPDLENVIFTQKVTNGIPYIVLHEAGSVVSSRVLSWFFIYATEHGLNFVWEVEGGPSFFGSTEFVETLRAENTGMEMK